MKRIYLDHSATTPVDEEVLQKMLPYFTGKFGNANSMHSFGQEGAYAVDESRRKIASLIGAKPNEIYFTSGGMEADNWAIKGMALKMREKGNHVITSSIEHAAIMSSCAQIAKEYGFEITYLPVNENGLVRPEDLRSAITDKTVLVSIMLANNEIGTIQPIKELAEIAHEKGIYFHTDAVQAVGSIPVSVTDLGVDLMSFSAHKFYGPKGVGVLYIHGGVKPAKLMTGGHQERTMRGGTTNVPGAVGMAAALEKAVNNL
ncbi:MAG: cysteine desulfurase, partial [Clostridia bacterium]|nr:cysteine desulfurase [Clostridia bacterium]